MKKRSGLFKISYKLTLMVVGIVVISTAVIATFSYIHYRNSSVNLIAENLLSISRSAASVIDPVQYREIMETMEPNEYHYWLTSYFTNKVEKHDIFFLHAGEIDHDTGFLGFAQAQMHDFRTGLGEITPAYQFPPEAFYAMNHGDYYLADTFYALDYGWVDLAEAILLIAYAPVFDEYGNTIAIVSAINIDSSVYAHSREFTTRLIGMSLVSMLILVWIPIYISRRYFSKPISKLSAATNSIVQGDLSGDLSSEVNIFSNDELGVLSDNFTVMQASIRDKIETERAAHQSELARGHAEAIAKAMQENSVYASKIQRNLLPPDSTLKAAFSDFSVVWKPRDIVGGDIYWMQQFDKGIVLCAADCTGHGTSGAFLTMLVVSQLDSIVTQENCDDTADILYQLDKKLATALNVQQELDLQNINDGCDIVAMFIANDGNITFSSGNINVFVCNSVEAIRNKGQRIYIGEGKLSGKDDVQTYRFTANPDNKFYIVSDGLYEQPGGLNGKTYGLKKFSEILVKHHSEKQEFILSKVWEAFEEYRGSEPRVDDFSLMAFTPHISRYDR